MIYSLLATCKKQGVEPSAWIEDVLKRIASHPINKLKELLPNNYRNQQQQNYPD